MRLLLDTHIWLWLTLEPARLPASFASAIATPENEILVSVASIWELSIKERLGKLVVPGSFQEFVGDALLAIRTLDIAQSHVERLHTLPAVHRDPFDRINVAQALAEDLVLATVDPVLAQYGVPLLPQSKTT